MADLFGRLKNKVLNLRHRSLTYWTIHKKPLTACGFLAHF